MVHTLRSNPMAETRVTLPDRAERDQHPLASSWSYECLAQRMECELHVASRITLPEGVLRTQAEPFATRPGLSLVVYLYCISYHPFCIGFTTVICRIPSKPAIDRTGCPVLQLTGASVCAHFDLSSESGYLQE